MKIEQRESFFPKQNKNWLSLRTQEMETERFDSYFEAKNKLTARQRIELAKQTLVVFGGAIAGIGIRLMTEPQVDQPGPLLGVLAIAAAYKMASIGFNACDEYDLLSRKLQSLKEMKDKIVKRKKTPADLVVVSEVSTKDANPSKAEVIEEGGIKNMQMTLDHALKQSSLSFQEVSDDSQKAVQVRQYLEGRAAGLREELSLIEGALGIHDEKKGFSSECLDFNCQECRRARLSAI